MRILIASSHRNIAGGVEKYLQELLPSLSARGHELALLYEYRFDPAKSQIDTPQLHLPCLGTDESGAEAGLRFARDWKPDAVYSQGLESADLQSALLDEYPTVLYAHNYVGTCISGEKCHQLPRARPCDRKFGPACLVLYYPRRCGGLRPDTTWKLYQRAGERNRQFPRFAAILVASEHMRREFARHGVNGDQIHLAPLPNPNQAALLDTPAKTAPGGHLLFLGRLAKAKGANELLRALPLAEQTLGRPLKLTVAGDGPERTGLESFATRHRLKVQFTGWIGDRQKAGLLADTDLLVAPSVWPEPFGLVGIEAGSYGVPAVAYDTGGISEWLIPRYSGELAPADPPTVDGLADAIVRALSNPGHYAELSRGAREVASRFTLAAHIAKLETTLEDAARLKSRVPVLPRPGQEAIHVDA